ncbi:hypothetical protein ACHOLT_13910 [Desulfitobacterium sp. Sab5]|uniref:hypothetical protein n=1 Tax=Desulfitobacterium nosdiversum TaxID=3375356 RepID=UPI003CECED9C
MRFHDLSHTSTSLLIAQVVPLKNVSSLLGHSSITITADIYATALQSADKDAAEELEDFLNTKKNRLNARSFLLLCARHGRSLTGESPECGLIVPST